MEHLSASQVGVLREKLLAQKAAIESGLADREAVLAHKEPIDSGEAASNESERRRLLLLSRHDKLQLEEVRAALQRIELGTYGICESTEEEIPFARLEISPWTRFTAEGQAQEEVEGRRNSVAFHQDETDEVY